MARWHSVHSTRPSPRSFARRDSAWPQRVHTPYGSTHCTSDPRLKSATSCSIGTISSALARAPADDRNTQEFGLAGSRSIHPTVRLSLSRAASQCIRRAFRLTESAIVQGWTLGEAVVNHRWSSDHERREENSNRPRRPARNQQRVHPERSGPAGIVAFGPT